MIEQDRDKVKSYGVSCIQGGEGVSFKRLRCMRDLKLIRYEMSVQVGKRKVTLEMKRVTKTERLYREWQMK